MINPATNAVITTVNVSNFGTEVPQYGVAVSPTGPAAGDVYVSSFTSESVLIINPATNARSPPTPSTSPTAPASGVAASPTGPEAGYVYVLNSVASNVDSTVSVRLTPIPSSAPSTLAAWPAAA